jgi:predicted nuclease with RNAse H fold
MAARHGGARGLAGAVVAVDAPGGTAGRAGGRLAEAELRRRGVALYSVPTDGEAAPGWMQAGWRVYELLRGAGLPEARTYAGPGRWAIECYPYAAYVALSGRGRPGGVAAASWARRILLEARGLRLAGTGKDAPDAVAAAVTALAFRSGEAVAYGDPEEGVIWVPGRLPDRLRASRRASGGSGGAANTDDAGPRAGSEVRLCLCGCGGVPVGVRSRFLPGHDAKLSARLRREFQGRQGSVGAQR